MRARGASPVVLAVPVAGVVPIARVVAVALHTVVTCPTSAVMRTRPPETVQRLQAVADEVVCTATPEHFLSVGGHYRDFRPVTDQEVRQTLTEARSD